MYLNPVSMKELFKSKNVNNAYLWRYSSLKHLSHALWDLSLVIVQAMIRPWPSNLCDMWAGIVVYRWKFSPIAPTNGRTAYFRIVNGENSSVNNYTISESQPIIFFCYH